MAQPGIPTGWQIIKLDCSRSDGNRAIHNPVTYPTWEQVQLAVESLDADRQSDLCLEAANGNTLNVGGGLGRYHVATQTGRNSQSGVAATLINPLGGEVVKGGVVIGGCQTDLPERLVVDLAMALSAAKRFYQDGGLEPSLAWEEC